MSAWSSAYKKRKPNLLTIEINTFSTVIGYYLTICEQKNNNCVVCGRKVSGIAQAHGDIDAAHQHK